MRDRYRGEGQGDGVGVSIYKVDEKRRPIEGLGFSRTSEGSQ